MQRLVAELQEKTAKAALGGPESSRTRHSARGKLLPRERIEQLVDPRQRPSSNYRRSPPRHV
jgi:3-methylcrotonyl-CoA carboxylase beta subunit